MIDEILGKVSAYAYAVEKGYTGTETQFAYDLAHAADYASTAGTAAENASESEENAKDSEEAAAQSEGNAEGYAQSAHDDAAAALEAKGQAIAAKNDAVTAKGLAENSATIANSAKIAAAQSEQNAYQFAESAEQDARDASNSASSASTSSLKSEGFAVGEQNGVPVESGSPYYENNSKYYSEQAAAQLGLVTAEGTRQIGLVTDEGTAQKAAVQEKGEQTLASIPEDYTTLRNDVSSLKSDIANTNDSLLNLNGIPVNVEFIDISDSTITQAHDRNVELTVTGINKFKLNGTASNAFSIPFDWGKTQIGGASTLYYLINRSDGVNRQDGVWVQLGWFLANNDPYQPSDNISVFNEITSYTYPATAVTTRNYLRIPSGASFDNTEFEIIIMRKTPLDTGIITKVDTMLLADSYNEVPLTWTLATGYWANNKTFATYNNIYTATVDVTSGEKYLLDAKSYYGMCIGVYYSGDTITADSIVDIIHLSNDEAWHYKYETQVPKDAEHLLLQQYNINRATIRKIEKNAVIKSSLSGKTIAYDGDSIAESRLTGNAANGGAYPYLIAEATGCLFANKSVSGGILASAVPSGTMPHSVVNSLGQLPNDADLYCIEGGVNDFWRDVPLGDYSQTDYNATVDTTTVCGALEHIIRAITYYHVGKPLVFVLVHKATGTINPNNAGYTFDQMREKMIGILNKYAIPYYDAYLYSGLNGYNSIQSTTFLTANSYGQGDGIHPNKAGYIRYYVPQLIQLFERIMPVNEED